MRHSRALRVCTAATVLLNAAACVPAALKTPQVREPTPQIDRNAQAASLLTQHLDLVQRLISARPAEQAEIAATAQREFELAPTPSHQLRYALILTTPSHAASDPRKGQQLLRQLAARPEVLAPVERAFAQLELQNLDQQLAVEAENQRLQTSVERGERERVAALNKRLQSEVDENTRLRRELETAQAKLDAIANLERSLNERRTTPEARKP